MQCKFSGITIDQIHCIRLEETSEVVHSALLEDWTSENGPSMAPDGTMGLKEQLALVSPLIVPNDLGVPKVFADIQKKFLMSKIQFITTSLTNEMDFVYCPYLYLKVLLAMLFKVDPNACLMQAVTSHNALNYVLNINITTDATLSLLSRCIQSILKDTSEEKVLHAIDVHSNSEIALTIVQTLLNFQTMY